MLYVSNSIFFANYTSKKLGKVFDKVKCGYSLPHKMSTRSENCMCVCMQLYQFSSVQSLGCVWLFATPWTAACQASLSITNSWSLLKLMSIRSVMPSNHLIFHRPLLLLPSVFPSIRVFPVSQFLASGSQSIGASASVLPVNIQDWLPLGLSGLTWENCACACVYVWFVPSKSLITELTQDCGNRLLEGTNKTCAHQDLGERSSDPTRDWPRPACECPGVYSGGVGWQWPAAASGALNTSSSLKKATIIFITPIIVWSQIKQQGRDTTRFINRKLDSGFTKHGPAHQNKTQFPPQSSLPSGSFHKPLILTCQRVRKTTNTEN